MSKDQREKILSDILKEMKLQTQILKCIDRKAYYLKMYCREMYQKDIGKALEATCCGGIERSDRND